MTDLAALARLLAEVPQARFVERTGDVPSVVCGPVSVCNEVNQFDVWRDNPSEFGGLDYVQPGATFDEAVAWLRSGVGQPHTGPTLFNPRELFP